MFNFVSEILCNFDGKVNRCKRLVTITITVYHPMLCKQVILASMEYESESTETVSQFWSLFNEILGKATGQLDYKFNPRGWCSDMVGSNLQGLKIVFGKMCYRRLKGANFISRNAEIIMHENYAQKNQETISRDFVMPCLLLQLLLPTIRRKMTCMYLSTKCQGNENSFLHGLNGGMTDVDLYFQLSLCGMELQR